MPRSTDLRNDVAAALTVTFLAVPQGIAYAMIAGLPPVMGLYAAAIPAIVGALARSSRHVVTGPSNAVSLLVGAGIAAHADLDPVATALTLALMVGVLQVGAGALRLGTIVNYISTPVVVGYITGAGVLIGVGQLSNLTATAGGAGNLFENVATWAGGLSGADGLAIALGLSTAAGIFLLRRWSRRIPSAVIMLALATLASWWLDFGARGLRRISDLVSIPSGLPPLTIPDLGNWGTLLPLAVAATVLSLVESSAVARAISSRTGQRLDMSREFAGQGLSNVAAALFGGYPTSGSLARSELNERAGAKTRLAGVLGGALMVGVLLGLGPLVDATPVAALAGLLMVIAFDLVNVPRIRSVLAGRRSDAAAFAATLLGTWLLPLDRAIYLGVGISLFLFLRRSRLLRITTIAVNGSGRPREIPLSEARSFGCSAIRLLHVDGQLFFAAAGELRAALDRVIDEPGVQVVILRLRRIQGLDVTALRVLEDATRRLQANDRSLMLVGVQPDDLALIARSELGRLLGPDCVRGGGGDWFQSVDDALATAHSFVGNHDPECPVTAYLSRHASQRRDNEAPAATQPPESKPDSTGTQREEGTDE